MSLGHKMRGRFQDRAVRPEGHERGSYDCSNVENADTNAQLRDDDTGYASDSYSDTAIQCRHLRRAR